MVAALIVAIVAVVPIQVLVVLFILALTQKVMEVRTLVALVGAVIRAVTILLPTAIKATERIRASSQVFSFLNLLGGLNASLFIEINVVIFVAWLKRMVIRQST